MKHFRETSDSVLTATSSVRMDVFQSEKPEY